MKLVGLAVLAGAAIDALTWLVARYGPQAADGQPWSFRGNGALVVPVALGPAVVAAAWTALVLSYRDAPRWLALSLAAGAVAVVLLLAAILALVVFGIAAMSASTWLSLAPVAWSVIAPGLAAGLPVHAQRRRNPLAYVVRGALTPVAVVVGFFGASQILAPGS